MKYLFSLLILFSLFSCGNSTYYQKNVLKKIGEFYGGDVTASSGFNNINTTRTNHFTVKISNSDLINNAPKNVTFSAGNIAYLSYSNLESKKAEYDLFNVVIALNTNETRSFTFTKDQLIQNEQIIKVLDNFNSFIIRKNYQDLLSISNTKFINSEQVYSDIFNKLYIDFGDIKQIQYQGFEFQEDENLGKCIISKQVIAFDKKNINIYIFTSLEDNKIVGFSFH